MMFAPDHGAAASEVARVTRPGGTVDITTWHPSEGARGLFEIGSRYASTPPPAGAGSPWQWGDPDYVQSRLGEHFELTFEERHSLQRAGSGEEMWEIFSTSFGPVKTLADRLEPERRAAYRSDFVAFDNDFRDGGEVVARFPYLVTVGCRSWRAAMPSRRPRSGHPSGLRPPCRPGLARSSRAGASASLQSV